MKTWEMVKELTEHPEKKFINQEGEKICLFVDEVNIESQLYITDEWEEVEEPVSFMEAVGALNKGKTIYVLHGKNYKYKEVFSPTSNKVDGGIALYQDQGYAIWTGLILYGKWYIE